MEKRFTKKDLLQMNTNEFRMFMACIDAGAYRLIGINWQICCAFYRDILSGDYVFKYL